MEIVGEKNLSVHKAKDYKIGTSQFQKKNPTDMAMIVEGNDSTRLGIHGDDIGRYRKRKDNGIKQE